MLAATRIFQNFNQLDLVSRTEIATVKANQGPFPRSKILEIIPQNIKTIEFLITFQKKRNENQMTALAVYVNHIYKIPVFYRSFFLNTVPSCCYEKRLYIFLTFAFI